MLLRQTVNWSRSTSAAIFKGMLFFECISVDDIQLREDMMFRVMFNTAFIRSSFLMLNRDEIDIMWDAKGQFREEFRAEVCNPHFSQLIVYKLCRN